MNIPLETDSIYLSIIDSTEHLQAAFKIDGGLVNPCSYHQWDKEKSKGAAHYSQRQPTTYAGFSAEGRHA